MQSAVKIEGPSSDGSLEVLLFSLSWSRSCLEGYCVALGLSLDDEYLGLVLAFTDLFACLKNAWRLTRRITQDSSSLPAGWRAAVLSLDSRLFVLVLSVVECLPLIANGWNAFVILVRTKINAMPLPSVIKVTRVTGHCVVLTVARQYFHFFNLTVGPESYGYGC